MRSVSIVNRTRQSVLGTEIGVADRWWQRARGFLRRPAPGEGEGLLLSPCRAVHMVGMSFALDIVFVDRHGRILALYPELAPGRRSAWHSAAKYALELRAGTIEATGTEVGDFVAWIPAEAFTGLETESATTVPAAEPSADFVAEAAAGPEAEAPNATETPRTAR